MGFHLYEEFETESGWLIGFPNQHLTKTEHDYQIIHNKRIHTAHSAQLGALLIAQNKG